MATFSLQKPNPIFLMLVKFSVFIFKILINFTLSCNKLQKRGSRYRELLGSIRRLFPC